MREPDDIGFPSKNLEKHSLNDRELAIAGQLVEAMTAPWEPERYKDEYRHALKDYVEKKYEEGDNFKPPEVPTEKPTPPTDIMELLQQSLAARGSSPTRAAAPKPAAKAKTAPRKTAAKK